ncbi:MAG: ADP-ribosylglycohydrolase family protein [Planctomycetota bacterium]|nr:ADP-ribosylglycohydrolase family protein [Planctomycetota bacterium]
MNQDDRSFESRIQRARLSLEGASLGDAFAHSCHHTSSRPKHEESDVWAVTEKSIMTWALVDVLESQGCVNQDRLAAVLAERYDDDPARGYGNNMHRVLSDISAGRYWERAAADLSGGRGCRGNSAATRVTPLGAFYGDDLERLVEETMLSAAVTHAHPDAAHGSLAVALSSAYFWRSKRFGKTFSANKFFDFILSKTPEGRVAKALKLASELPKDCSSKRAAELLGAGARFHAVDTVPLALCIVSRYPNNFEGGVREAVAIGIDTESLATIVGGVIAQSCSYRGFPPEWRGKREKFEQIQPDPLFCDYEESDEELLLASSED